MAYDMILVIKDAPNTGCRSISCSCGGWPSSGFGMAPGGYGKRARWGPAARGSTRGWAPEPGGHTRHSPPPTPCQQQFVRVQRHHNSTTIQSHLQAHHSTSLNTTIKHKHNCWCMHVFKHTIQTKLYNKMLK